MRLNNSHSKSHINPNNNMNLGKPSDSIPKPCVDTDETLCSMVCDLKFLLKTADDRTPLKVSFEKKINEFIKQNNLGNDERSFCRLTDPESTMPPDPLFKNAVIVIGSIILCLGMIIVWLVTH